MQPWNSRAMLLVGALLFATAGALAQEKSDPSAKPGKSDQATDTNPGFEKLKQLAGEWIAADDANPPAG